jgi:hypothetical protein
VRQQVKFARSLIISNTFLFSNVKFAGTPDLQFYLSKKNEYGHISQQSDWLQSG